MRIRTIKPEFFTHERLFDAERESALPLRLAFVGLWCAADRDGRFRWEPRRLSAAILPYDEIEFSRVLHALVTRGFIVRYRVGDAWFGCIPSWRRHQVINNRERPSDIPDVSKADEVNNACPTRAPRVDDACPTALCKVQEEGKGKEGKGMEYRAPADAAAPADSLLSLEPAPMPAEKPKTERARDPLFDALASVDGSNPRELTQRAARACGVALAEIRRASPAVTADEITRRAANYRTHMPDVTISPNALASHWAKCANAPAGKGGSWNPGTEDDGSAKY